MYSGLFLSRKIENLSFTGKSEAGFTLDGYRTLILCYM